MAAATWDLSCSKSPAEQPGAGGGGGAGGSASAALLYAPNASASFTGNSDFYGAVVSNKVTDMGGVHLHYDRRLSTEQLVAGNFTMGSFSWKSY